MWLPSTTRDGGVEDTRWLGVWHVQGVCPVDVSVVIA